MSSICKGLCVTGAKNAYLIAEQLHRSVWLAADYGQKKWIFKIAPKRRYQHERDILVRFRGHDDIRQLHDEIKDPPAMILEHLDTDMLEESATECIPPSALRQVAWHTLHALAALHEAGYVHTDVKPDNILVNRGQTREKYSKIALSDNGDLVYLPSLPASEEGHIIGAHIFRSPEAMLNLKWGPATDIWSLGTTLTSLMMGRGWHIFKPDPKIVKPDEQTYPFHVFYRHDQFFGPFPNSFAELADTESLEILEWVNRNCEIRTPFARAADKEVSEEARMLICKMMMLDPRDRPSARSLLEDAWFADYKTTIVP